MCSLLPTRHHQQDRERSRERERDVREAAIAIALEALGGVPLPPPRRRRRRRRRRSDHQQQGTVPHTTLLFDCFHYHELVYIHTYIYMLAFCCNTVYHLFDEMPQRGSDQTANSYDGQRSEPARGFLPVFVV